MLFVSARYYSAQVRLKVVFLAIWTWIRSTGLTVWLIPSSTSNPGTTFWLWTEVRENTRSFFNLPNMYGVAESPRAFSLKKAVFVVVTYRFTTIGRGDVLGPSLTWTFAREKALIPTLSDREPS